MLYIVLILVLAALGLLVAALITANSLWAWVSIGLSVLAGLLLAVDYVRRRHRRRRPAVDESDESTGDATVTGETAGGADEAAPVARLDDSVTGTAGPAGSGEGARTTGEAGEPGEEATSPEHARLVAGLAAEVVVVDEYPRYHFRDCGWLEGRTTIPLAVGEARELGFTPCVRCAPDARLVAAHRTGPAS